MLTQIRTNILETEKGISLVKRVFAGHLNNQLNLANVSAPLVVLDGTGINDDLSGLERPVSFPIRALNNQNGVVVHSLAKWKRLRLQQLDIEPGNGILTDMRALRPDEDYSPIHSIYVDQWDWELCIAPNNRTLTFLKETVSKIYVALQETERAVERAFPDLKCILPNKIEFVHAEALLQRYPLLSPKDRECAIAKEFGAVFIIGIGHKLTDGLKHDDRAPDYDDWSTQNEMGYFGLNGDIILWNSVLDCAFEISSMGIRVDKKALMVQLCVSNCEERASLMYHKTVLNGNLPNSIGGGIGQSRVCMFMLRKKQIGEVQVSIWSNEITEKMKLQGVQLM